MNTIDIVITGGPTVTVPFTPGMNVQQALEIAFDAERGKSDFTYALQYFGHDSQGNYLGYLVVMINETYESFMSSLHPFFFWEFLLNGTPATKGIDPTILNPGDVVTFEFETYDVQRHQNSTLKAKYDARMTGTSK